MFVPPRPPRPPRVPDALKAEVDAQARALVESVLKPRHVKEPPDDPRFNYITDVSIKWYGSWLYFCARFACPGPNALSPWFEDRFTRMEYAGNERWHLAYRRYTGQWLVLYQNLSLDACLTAIRDEAHFWPPG
jgi:hypothetical protein